MVEIPDIKDRYSLEAWLEGQPPEVSVWIASRAAARALPVWWYAVLTERWARDRDLTALPALHNVSISSVAAVMPTDEIRFAANAARAAAKAARAVSSAYAADAANAARAAANAGRAAAYPADAANTVRAVATYAADAVDAVRNVLARAADQTVWRDTRTDAEQVSEGRLRDALPLWPGGQNPFQKKWSQIKAQVAASPDAGDWQFWIDWYDAQLAGRTMLPDPARTWDMLEQIALIKPATWDAGPEVVNPRIREIWESYRGKVPRELEILQAADDGVVLGYNVETDRFYQEDIKAENQSRLQTAVAKLNEVRLLVGQMGNLQGVLTSEIFLIDRAVQDHPENATMVFFNTKAARGLLQANIENGSCPSPQSEPVIGLLDTMLFDTQNTLLLEPSVQEGLKARAEDSSLLDSPESLKALEDAADEIAEVSEGALADELSENAKKAKDPYQPRAVRVNALISTVSAVVQSWVIARCARFKTALEELDDITVRTARISKNLAITIGAGGPVLYAAVQVVTNSPKVEAAIKAIIALF
ncbi:hypothetical protein [Roseovarius sp. D22-M7]|uniref:hypothetical protein n=1 Tax=Roseovarius sp. D22-M7 TaxID=3127116 RepID=UPI00300FEFBE